MPAQTVDYDALATQHGGTSQASGVDYDALAQQHGGKSAFQAPPIGTISARQSGISHPLNWLEDLQGDIRYGTGATWVGRILQKMGARGINMGVSPGVADTIGGPAIGPVKVAHGLGSIVDNADAISALNSTPQNRKGMVRALNETTEGVGLSEISSPCSR
jgi:hypothetical protein